MKVLINGINFSPELTGIGKYTGELADYLVEAGHEVRVVTAPPYYPHWKVQPGYSWWRYRREQRQGIDVYRCPLWVPARPGGLKRVLHLASFAMSSLLPTILLAAWHPEIVIAVAPAILSAPGALLAARLAGAHAWLHIQDLELDTAASLGMLPDQSRIRAIACRLEAWLIRHFDSVSTLSESMLTRISEKGVNSHSGLLLPNWVDTSQICPQSGPSGFKARLGFSQDQMVVLYAGSIGRKQGLGILIDAAQEINDPRIQFVICGDGVARQALQEKAMGMHNVTFIPVQPLEKLNDLLNLADIHVLPQLPGAADLVMPSKLSGMLASGKVVIATAEPGTELYRVVSKVGMTIPPGDLPGLVNAIQCLAEDPLKRERMGAKGRQFVEQTWDKQAVLGAFLSQINSMNDMRK